MKKKQTTRPTAVTPREFVITSPLIIDQLTTELAILPIENVELVGGDTAQENQTAVITAEVTPSHPEDLFRWYLGDRALALQPQNKLHLVDVPLSLDGMTIKCMVMRPGEQGTLKITAETTLQIAPQLPNIVASQPLHQVAAGSTLRLSVVGKTAQDVGYQWLFEDEPIQGAVGETLLVRGCDAQHDGTYTVQVNRGFRRVATSVDVRVV